MDSLRTNPNGKATAKAISGPLDFDELYRQHAAEVLRWAIRLSGSTSDGEDIAHDVFLRAQNKLRSWQDAGGNVRTWFYRTTFRVVQERRRATKLRRWLGLTVAENAEPAIEEQPMRELEKKQTAALVYDVLDALPERLRAALIMFEIEGLSGEEIAAVFDRPVANVWVWLHRARARFLAELKQRGLNPDLNLRRKSA